MSAFFRFLCLILAVLVIVASTADSSVAADKKPHIFINTASSIGFLATNVGMVGFSEIAREKGFTISHGLQPGFADPSAFDGIDVYILFDPTFPLTTQNKIMLRQWVRAGGILITSDWHTTNEVGGFVAEFGIEFGQWAFITRDMYFPAESPLSEPLSVSSMLTRYGRDITITDPSISQAIIKYDDGTVSAARTIANAGEGEIITYACLATLCDGTVGGDIDLADNESLVRNLLDYIKDRLEGTTGDGCDLKLRKIRSKGGQSFVPGDEIKLVAKIKNLGSETSESTRVAFYIEWVGNSAGIAKKVEFSSATVPAIKGKKKVKIVKRTFLPDDLKPGGVYEITAIADPDGLTDDTNTDNNYGKSKKKIIIE